MSVFTAAKDAVTNLATTEVIKERLEKVLEETVRLSGCIEFRSGPRTGDTWQPFCPACHHGSGRSLTQHAGL